MILLFLAVKIYFYGLLIDLRRAKLERLINKRDCLTNKKIISLSKILEKSIERSKELEKTFTVIYQSNKTKS